MRIVLSILLVFIQLAAVADSTLSLNTHYYNLHPGLNVIKPSIDYKNELSLDTTLNARLTVDRVHTDPIDAISSASQTMGETIAKTDIRQEYLAGVSHIMGNWKLGAGFLVSMEEDYRSYSPSLLLSKDFNLRNTTVGFGYAHNFDQVHGQYMEKEQEKNVDNFSLSLTQVLSQSTLMQVGYSHQINDGFLGTGNRKLVLENGLEYDEYLPSYRKRQAQGIRLAQWFSFWDNRETVVHLGYRYYTDDWELTSDTLEVSLYQTLSSYLKIKMEYRFYNQSRAYFAKDTYDGTEKYLTTANSLRAFSSTIKGLNLIYTPKNYDKYQLTLGIESYRQSSGLFGELFRISLQRKI